MTADQSALQRSARRCHTINTHFTYLLTYLLYKRVIITTSPFIVRSSSFIVIVRSSYDWVLCLSCKFYRGVSSNTECWTASDGWLSATMRWWAHWVVFVVVATRDEANIGFPLQRGL